MKSLFIKSFIILFFCGGTFNILLAQCNDPSPKWANDKTQLFDNYKDFIYIVGKGFGENETLAEDSAYYNARKYVINRKQGRYLDKENSTPNTIEKNDWAQCFFVRINNDSKKTKAYVLYKFQRDYGVDNAKYDDNLLFDNSFEEKLEQYYKCIYDGSLTTKYPISFRTVIPGAAQMHKGSKTKASLIIAGEAICIGGIILSYALPPYYDSKFNQTHDVNKKKDYLDKIDFCNKPLRYTSWGLAGAVFIYSFLDGWLAPGKPYQKLGNAELNVLPYTSSHGGGLTLALTF